MKKRRTSVTITDTPCNRNPANGILVAFKHYYTTKKAQSVA